MGFIQHWSLPNRIGCWLGGRRAPPAAARPPDRRRCGLPRRDARARAAPRIATPLLVAIGIPPIIAVAAPLPATVPGTLVAADGYRRKGLIDRQVLLWSLIAGVPATIVGAILTRWISGDVLVYVTDVVIVVLGVRMLLAPRRRRARSPTSDDADPHDRRRRRHRPRRRPARQQRRVPARAAVHRRARPAHQARAGHVARRRRGPRRARHDRAPGARPHRLGDRRRVRRRARSRSRASVPGSRSAPTAPGSSACYGVVLVVLGVGFLAAAVI